MKKFIFFVLLACCASFVHAQSSKSIGLTTSYFSHLTSYNSLAGNKIVWKEDYKSPQLSFIYNHFFNEAHGIISEIGISQEKNSIGFPALGQPATFFNRKYYHLNYSLHYIFKHQHFFVKSGLNTQFFNIMKSVEETQGDATISPRKTSITWEEVQTIPEFHFALGRDFDLGKINIRVNGFVERAFILDDYIDFGLSAGVFYQFSK